MPDLLRIDPFFHALDPLLPGLRVASRRRAKPRADFVPRFEVREDEHGYRLFADLPGVADADLDIQLDGSELTVRGKRDKAESAEGETLHFFERSFGEFSRTFKLPDEADPDGVEARLERGVLTIKVPKRASAKPRKIRVGAA